MCMARNTIEVRDNVVPGGDEYTVEQVGGSIKITLETGETTMLVPKEVQRIVKGC